MFLNNNNLINHQQIKTGFLYADRSACFLFGLTISELNKNNIK